MDKEIEKVKKRVREYYGKVGQLHIDPLDVPEHPDEIELWTGWFWNRVRSIVTIENSHRKFGDMKEVLVLLDVAAKDLGMKIKFSYFPDIGQLYLEYNEPEDYLNLPMLAKHFAMLYRFKWRPNTIAEGDPETIFDESEVVYEGSGDMFAYVRSEHGAD